MIFTYFLPGVLLEERVDIPATRAWPREPRDRGPNPLEVVVPHGFDQVKPNR